MQEKLEKFLVDKKAVNEILENSFDKIKIYKEDYDDRFSILYTKDFTESFYQKQYTNSAYFDKKEGILYLQNSILKEFIKPSFKFDIKSIQDVEKELIQKMEEYISEYSLKHQEEFIKIIEHDSHDTYYSRDFNKQQVFKKFFDNEKDIEYSVGDYCRNLYRLPERENHNMFYDFFNETEKTVKKYSEMIMEKNREEIGRRLKEYKSRQNYLDCIYENKNGEFDYLYQNKKIYDSIKYLYAKNVNITVEYNNLTHTFKFDCQRLFNDLSQGKTSSSDYGASYELVSKFVKENDPDYKDNRDDSFKFSNVVNISYGKNEVYNRDEVNKELENEEIEMEM